MKLAGLSALSRFGALLLLLAAGSAPAQPPGASPQQRKIDGVLGRADERPPLALLEDHARLAAPPCR